MVGVPVAQRLAGILVVLVAIALATAQWTPGGRIRAQSAPAISVQFGESEVWTPSDDAIAALHGCGRVSFTCVQGVMQADGASDDAVAFFRLTGWFLARIDDAGGPIALAQVFNPWRANENTQPALLGGIPAIVLPEEEAQLLNLAAEVERDPGWAAIIAANPNALFWGSSPALENITTSPSGGQRFVFDYHILAGCHACAVLGLARVAFDFDPDGTFDGGRLLELAPPPTGP